VIVSAYLCKCYDGCYILYHYTGRKCFVWVLKGSYQSFGNYKPAWLFELYVGYLHRDGYNCWNEEKKTMC